MHSFPLVYKVEICANLNRLPHRSYRGFDFVTLAKPRSNFIESSRLHRRCERRYSEYTCVCHCSEYSTVCPCRLWRDLNEEKREFPLSADDAKVRMGARETRVGFSSVLSRIEGCLSTLLFGSL